jgi:uncharacterized protein YjiS (DUF1127 family)
MICSSPRVVALRATYVHYPRDGELLRALIAGLERLLLRFCAWREARRRAWDANRWLETASERDLADIGLTRAHRRDPRHAAWEVL